MLILSHLSRDVTSAVLVHEVMHAVVSRAGRPLQGSDEEGLCELASWRYARSRKLPRFVLTGIEENEVSEYREAFRRQRAKGKPLRTILLGGS